MALRLRAGVGDFDFLRKGRNRGHARAFSSAPLRAGSCFSRSRIFPAGTRRRASAASRTARRSPGASCFPPSKKSPRALRSAPLTHASSSRVRTAHSALRSPASRANRGPLSARGPPASSRPGCATRSSRSLRFFRPSRSSAPIRRTSSASSGPSGSRGPRSSRAGVRKPGCDFDATFGYPCDAEARRREEKRFATR